MNDAGTARADYCRLLAACFYQPDSAFAEERMFATMAAAGGALGAAFASDALSLDAAFAREELQDLLVDYTRLFIGPVGTLAQPYGTSWLGRDGASPVLPVLAFYDEGGFAIAEDFLELPDHVAAELEFCYLLAFRQSQAEAAGELDALAKWEDLERRFLDTQLGAWIEPFCSAVATRAATAFYRMLAAAAVRFVAAERERLG